MKCLLYSIIILVLCCLYPFSKSLLRIQRKYKNHSKTNKCSGRKNSLFGMCGSITSENCEKFYGKHNDQNVLCTVVSDGNKLKCKGIEPCID